MNCRHNSVTENINTMQEVASANVIDEAKKVICEVRAD